MCKQTSMHVTEMDMQFYVDLHVQCSSCERECRSTPKTMKLIIYD